MSRAQAMFGDRRPELPQRLQVRLRARGIAAIAGDHGHHGLAWRARASQQAHVHGQFLGGLLGEVAVEAERLTGPADGMVRDVTAGPYAGNACSCWVR